MPAFLDLVGPRRLDPRLLACRQSFRPEHSAGVLHAATPALPHKRKSLAFWTATMAVPFLSLSASVVGLRKFAPAWMAWFFLSMYLSSPAPTAQSNFVQHAARKLVPIKLRWRLLALSLPLGCGAAVAFAWWLMGDWLRSPTAAFTRYSDSPASAFCWARGSRFFVAERADDEIRPANGRV